MNITVWRRSVLAAAGFWPNWAGFFKAGFGFSLVTYSTSLTFSSCFSLCLAEIILLGVFSIALDIRATRTDSFVGSLSFITLSNDIPLSFGAGARGRGAPLPCGAGGPLGARGAGGPLGGAGALGYALPGAYFGAPFPVATGLAGAGVDRTWVIAGWARAGLVLPTAPDPLFPELDLCWLCDKAFFIYDETSVYLDFKFAFASFKAALSLSSSISSSVSNISGVSLVK